MKIRNYLLIISSVLLLNHNILAATSSGSDYYPDYYENEGNMILKIRGFYASTGAKTKGFPAPTNPGSPAASGALIQNGAGFDVATSFFFTDNIATELSLGLIYYRTKGSTSNSVFISYGTGKNTSKKKNIYSIPASATLQYHIAPYGAIRPYVGAGFHGTYMSSQSKQFKIKNGYGAVLQAGVDFVGKDDTIINLDVRQFLLESRVHYKSSFLNTRNDVSSKVKLNPILVSVGIGFKF